MEDLYLFQVYGGVEGLHMLYRLLADIDIWYFPFIKLIMCDISIRI